MLEPAFSTYFNQILGYSDLQEDFEALTKIADIYLFSGIIRDFFTGNIYRERDLDIVVDFTEMTSTMSARSFLCHYAGIRRNSFGGFKIMTNNKKGVKAIDIWQLSDTKYIKDNGLPETVDSLLESPFFNFSAIVYDCTNKKFIFTDKFVEFCNTNSMEVVNSENPNSPLCVVNSIYYSLMYGFKIGKTLKQWIVDHYNVLYNYEETQRKHFGMVFYDNDTILRFIDTLNTKKYIWNGQNI